MKSKLRVFVAHHCPGCAEALGIADRINQDHAQAFSVEIIDINDEQAIIPERVFATPTYMIDDRVVSLGNPSQEQVEAWIETARPEKVLVKQAHDCGC